MGAGSRIRKYLRRFSSRRRRYSSILHISAFIPKWTDKGTVSSRRLNPIVAAFSSLTAVGAVAGSASISEEEVEGLSLEKYVKSQLPDGFAAQRTIGAGRRKCAIARVVLQGGTGKFVINYRDAQEYLQGNPLWLQYIKTPLSTLG
ncbi:small ribosomal subunit protein uS9c-like [Curcuma longa]|uniref:small ribosomal subunit protein uS9c-like n=1 Tax=Curcuma longa TaxID=136217 RepID=UPI003D9F1622